MSFLLVQPASAAATRKAKTEAIPTSVLRCDQFMGALPRHTPRVAPTARTRTSASSAAAAAEIGRRLARAWPDAECELRHTSAFELLVGTILAAQSTDKLVNTITPTLLARW